MGISLSPLTIQQEVADVEGSGRRIQGRGSQWFAGSFCSTRCSSLWAGLALSLREIRLSKAEPKAFEAIAPKNRININKDTKADARDGSKRANGTCRVAEALNYRDGIVP
jgi:hypothetical protein